VTPKAEPRFCVTDTHIQGYIKSLLSRQVSEQTLVAYRRELKALQDALGTTGDDLTGITALRAQLAQARANGLKPASLARRLAAWRSFLRWLAETRQADALQAGVLLGQLKALRPPRPGRPLPKLLSVEEAVVLAKTLPSSASNASGSNNHVIGVRDDERSVLEETGSTLNTSKNTNTPTIGSRDWYAQWSPIRDHAILELLYSCGLRVSELTGLDTQASGPWTGWLDLQANELVVMGKGSKLRRLPVGRPAIEAAQNWLAARARVLLELGCETSDGPVFIDRLGARLHRRAVHRIVHAAAKRLGLSQPVHPHMLRHSFASHLLQSSGDLRAVQELLGHAQITTTQVYTHLDFQRLAQVYDKTHPRARRKAKGFGTIGS
jgi:integrase/recombinase XerC